MRIKINNESNYFILSNLHSEEKHQMTKNILLLQGPRDSLVLIRAFSSF